MIKSILYLLLDFTWYGAWFGLGCWILLFKLVPYYADQYPDSKVSQIASVFFLKRGLFPAIFLLGFVFWLGFYALGVTGYLIAAFSLGSAFFIVRFFARIAGVGFEESVEEEKRRKEKEFDRYFG